MLPVQSKAGVTLVADGKAQAVIVLPRGDLPGVVSYAASELQYHVQKATLVRLQIVSEDVIPEQPAGRVYLGDCQATRHAQIDSSQLPPEAFVLKTKGNAVFIAGRDQDGDPLGNDQLFRRLGVSIWTGTLFGVYELLEDHLGCRWFTPTVSHIPKQKRLVVGSIDETKVPVLEYREPFVMDCYDGDWCARNRMNSSAGRLEERHGGKVRFGARLFVHTFNVLMPPDKYFDEHPEYFSEVEGKRVKSLKQWQELGYDEHSITADPLFVDADNDDYRLNPSSPAFKLGFKQIDIDKIGIRSR